MSRQTKGKILVIRGGAIGDFILTLPAIAALRKQFPETHLEVLGYPHIVQLAIAGGLVDRAQSIEARALAGFFARGGALEEDLGDYFAEFNLIVSYLYDPDEIFRTNVARCSRAQFIVGPHRPNESERIHATQVYLKPLERLAIFDADPVPRLTINHLPVRQSVQRDGGPVRHSAERDGGPVRHSAERDGGPVRHSAERDGGSTTNQLALHPGSGSEKKNWPEARWAELLQHLINATPYQLLLVGGEAEGERLQRLAAALPPARLRVAQSVPLSDLAVVLQRCAGFVGHDSGISHLAAALGLPGIVLWGDTTEEIWRPPQGNVRVIRNDGGLKAITVRQVVDGLGEVLATH